MKVHRGVPPPKFEPPADVPFVMHYAPHGKPGPDGRTLALGTRACDGGPMADLANVEAAIRLFEEKEIYVAPRWSSANMPGSVTCEACKLTKPYLEAAALESLSSGGPVDAETAATFSNPGTLIGSSLDLNTYGGS